MQVCIDVFFFSALMQQNSFKKQSSFEYTLPNLTHILFVAANVS